MFYTSVYDNVSAINEIRTEHVLIIYFWSLKSECCLYYMVMDMFWL